MILNAQMLSTGASVETWRMVVNIPDTGFFAQLASEVVQVTAVIDKAFGQLIRIELESND